LKLTAASNGRPRLVVHKLFISVQNLALAVDIISILYLFSFFFCFVVPRPSTKDKRQSEWH